MDWKQAAQSGNIDGLYELFRHDPWLLERIGEVPFVDTPMHIAAAEGKIAFAVEMMNLKPSFATKMNPDGLTPVHIALLNHRNLLYELLKINQDLVRVKGKKGMTLLHYAAEQGDIDLLVKFLMTCPESITDVTVEGKTVLHIAAERNKLEALQLLVRWLQRTHNKGGSSWESDVINWKDSDGNTVLHAAASNIHNQVEMIRLLSKCICAEKSVINSSGLMALDILQQQSNPNSEAIAILSKARGPIRESKPISEQWRREVLGTEKFIVILNRMRGNIPSDYRNALLVLAGLVLTGTYQALYSPPGGVRQVDAEGPHDAGRSVMEASSFILFFAPNTVAFFLTLFLTVIFLMIGPEGEPGELGFLPAVPIGICYIMSALVITPTPKFNYLIWVTFGIALAFTGWLFCAHERWIFWARRYATGPYPIPFNNVLLY